MKKHRQVILICTGLLLISTLLVAVMPGMFADLTRRRSRDAEALGSVGKYERTCHDYLNIFANQFTYEKYTYAEAEFEDNPYFNPVTQSDMDRVRVYAEYFSKCVDTLVGLDDLECAALVEHYDFDPACIAAGDYVYFKESVPEQDADENERSQFCFYYFDAESSTMYYFKKRIGYRTALNSIGKYECVLYHSMTSFRAFMDYGKYVYSVARLEDNEYFRPITSGDMEELRAWAGWFSSWAEDCGDSVSPGNRRFFKNYDFDPACITADDYVYIDSPGAEHVSIYFFDTGSNTLHYFRT